MAALLDGIAPPRLGSGFRWLLASSWVSNLGDGFALAAGPLLVASRTRDPILVGLAVLLQQLPWLLFGLYAGALADRLNRRAIVIAADFARGIVLAALSLLIVTGQASIGVVLPALFVLGTAEVFADTTSGTLLPMLLARSDLALGNARLQTGYLTLNQLAGPPLGAALFAAGAWSPFCAQAVLVVAGVVLVSRVALPTVARTAAPAGAAGDIRAGFRWVIGNGPVRTLVLTIFIFNITFGAAMSVLVLYAREHLGMGSVGFGLLTAMSAAGGVAGTAAYAWITRHISLGNLMRIGLIIETLTHLALALTSRPAVAMAIFFVFGAHAFIWGTTSITVRQRAVPTELQGRVGGVNALGVYGGMVIGSAVGGPIAHRWGLTAPFWFAFGGSALFLVGLWGQLTQIAHADAGSEPASAAR